MRHIGWFTLLLLVAPFVSTEAAVSPAIPRGLCDMRNIQKGLWCEKCYKVIDLKELKKLKKKTCPTCDGKITAPQFCVKPTYLCIKSPRPKPNRCKCCKKTIVKLNYSLIVLRCTGCGKEGSTTRCTEPVCRAKGRRRKRACKKTGSPPHNTP